MQAEEKNIKIAAFCGLVPCDKWVTVPPSKALKRNPLCGHSDCYPVELQAPPYSTSVDWMIKAEKFLGPEQSRSYCALLSFLHDYKGTGHGIYHVNAKVRSDCFIETIDTVSG